MLKLQITSGASSAPPTAVHTILDGQTTEFRPVSVAMILAARSAADRARLSGGDDGAAAFAWTLSICVAGIVSWTGVCDENGAPVAVTPAAIEAYLRNWRVYRRIEELYTAPALMDEPEKNASAPSQSGISGARTPAKTIADIAHSLSAAPSASTA